MPADLSRQALEKGRAWAVRLLSGHFGIRYEMRSFATLGGGVTGYLAGEEDEALDGAAVLLVEALAAGGERCLVEPVAAGALQAAAAAGVSAGSSSEPGAHCRAGCSSVRSTSRNAAARAWRCRRACSPAGSARRARASRERSSPR